RRRGDSARHISAAAPVRAQLGGRARRRDARCGRADAGARDADTRGSADDRRRAAGGDGGRGHHRSGRGHTGRGYARRAGDGGGGRGGEECGGGRGCARALIVAGLIEEAAAREALDVLVTAGVIEQAALDEAAQTVGRRLVSERSSERYVLGGASPRVTER